MVFLHNARVQQCELMLTNGLRHHAVCTCVTGLDHPRMLLIVAGLLTLGAFADYEQLVTLARCTNSLLFILVNLMHKQGCMKPEVPCAHYTSCIYLHHECFSALLLQGAVPLTVSRTCLTLLRCAVKQVSSPAGKHSQPLQLACVGSLLLHEGPPQALHPLYPYSLHYCLHALLPITHHSACITLRHHGHLSSIKLRKDLDSTAIR